MRTFYQNAGAVCKGRTSAENSRIRYFGRYLINNSNTTASLMTCNLMTDFTSVPTPAGSNKRVGSAGLWLRNTTAAPVDVTCTFISGFQTSSDSVSITKTTTVPNDGVQYLVQILPSDNAGAYYQAPINVECTLPPKIEINDTVVYYFEDVGA